LNILKYFINYIAEICIVIALVGLNTTVSTLHVAHCRSISPPQKDTLISFI